MKKFVWLLCAACLFVGCDSHEDDETSACDAKKCKVSGGVCQADQCVLPLPSCDEALCKTKGGSCQGTQCVVATTGDACDAAACSAQNGTCQGDKCIVEAPENKCDATACAKLGGTCKGDKCVLNEGPVTCDEAACKAEGGACNGNTCVKPEPAKCDDAACKAQGGTCQGDKCVVIDGGNCDEAACKAQGGTCKGDLCDIEDTPATCDEAACKAEGGTCDGNTCVKTEPAKCDEAACKAQGGTCKGDVCQMPTQPSEPCGNVTCNSGYTCSNGVCKAGDGTIQGGRCGANWCKATETCINNNCVDRSKPTKYTEGDVCNPATFIEQCDGNKLVYCASDADDSGEVTNVVRVSDCEADTCAIRADANYGFCARKEDKCSAATAGEFTYCKVETNVDGSIMAGAASYLELFDCVPDTKGEYHVFRNMSMKTDDCELGCKNDYECMSTKPGTKNHCDGDLVYYCEKGTCSPLNCSHYSVRCLDDGKGNADCDWENMPIE